MKNFTRNRLAMIIRDQAPVFSNGGEAHHWILRVAIVTKLKSQPCFLTIVKSLTVRVGRETGQKTSYFAHPTPCRVTDIFNLVRFELMSGQKCFT